MRHYIVEPFRLASEHSLAIHLRLQTQGRRYRGGGLVGLLVLDMLDSTAIVHLRHRRHPGPVPQLFVNRHRSIPDARASFSRQCRPCTLWWARTGRNNCARIQSCLLRHTGRRNRSEFIDRKVCPTSARHPSGAYCLLQLPVGAAGTQFERSDSVVAARPIPLWRHLLLLLLQAVHPFRCTVS